MECQHNEAFEEASMYWPVDLSTADHDCLEVNTSGVLHREIEVAVFVHKVFALLAKMSLSSATATSPLPASLPTRLMRTAMSDKALGS